MRNKQLPPETKKIIRVIFKKHLGLSPNNKHYDFIQNKWYHKLQNYKDEQFKTDLIDDVNPDLILFLFKLCQQASKNIPTKKSANFKRVSLYLNRISKLLKG